MILDMLIYWNDISLYNGAFNDDKGGCTNEKYGEI